MASISREFASWVAGLSFSDIPADVVDRAKALTLQGFVSTLLGYRTSEGRQALSLIEKLDGETATGASVLYCGRQFHRTGAAYANSEMMFAGGKWDTFQMLTHPGCAILPAALAAAEAEKCSGETFLTGVIAGYEVMERLAFDFVPTVMSRGFHAGPVFGIFGAAIAAAKIAGQSEEQLHATITQCVNLASGNLEGARSGGRGVREGAAVRNALFAVALGEQRIGGGDSVFEGPAGFFHSYAGDHQGKLVFSFAGKLKADLPEITADLGRRWKIMETLIRIYATAGYNNPHISVTSSLCETHDIAPDDVVGIECVVNWLETQYPNPSYPSERTDIEPGPERPHYYAAYAVLERGFPLTKYVAKGWGDPDPDGLQAMMKKVRVIPSHTQPLFSPRVTIFTKGGKAHTAEATGREMIFTFGEVSSLLTGVGEQAGLSRDGYSELVRSVGDLDGADGVSAVVSACTLPQ